MLFGIMRAIQYCAWSRCGGRVRAICPAGLTGDGWLRPREWNGRTHEPILSTDCARLPDLSFVAPLQMEMATVSKDAAAGVNYGLDKGPLLAPVKASARVRLRVTLMDMEQEEEASSPGFGQATADRGRSSRPAREPEKSGCGRSRAIAARGGSA